jgi:molybdate transport repressor ModE-like protein
LCYRSHNAAFSEESHDSRHDEQETPAEVQSKIWIEREGKVVLSDWRAELLQAIEEAGSLSGAAARMDVPYRTAWYKLKEIEEQLGVRLVETHSGGSDGGGSSLTAEGQDILRASAGSRRHRETVRRRSNTSSAARSNHMETT